MKDAKQAAIAVKLDFGIALGCTYWRNSRQN